MTTTSSVETDRWAIHCGDALEVMRSMADSSVDAVVTDPPYFKVKDEAWDHAWDTPAQFLAWFDQLAEQFEKHLDLPRILAICGLGSDSN